jgi:pseudouridine synthase
MKMRLVRYLALCGVASRRHAADLVRAGVVEVNGVATTNVALEIGPDDRVCVRGRRVCPAARSATLMLNKPPGLVCSRRDPHNPRTVYECLPLDLRSRVKPVGRLDKETTGLLLLTDDGALAYRLMHPRYGVEKTYRVVLEGVVADDVVAILREGIQLDDGPTSPARVRVLRREKGRSEIEITIHEGRNRQVRRMCEAVGHRVLRLERTNYGPISLGVLKRGETRPLTDKEISALRAAAGLAEKPIST